MVAGKYSRRSQRRQASRVTFEAIAAIKYRSASMAIWAPRATPSPALTAAARPDSPIVPRPRATTATTAWITARSPPSPRARRCAIARLPVGQRGTPPTVKPTDLMCCLCRLVTPAGGLVLDPFMGCAGIDPAGGPAAADRVRAWADTLMAELYSAHVARWEYLHADDFARGCRAEANAEQVYYGPQRGLVIRALFDKPRVPQPEKDHVFKNCTCTRCGDPEDWAGPDCVPLAREVDPRARLPFDPRWLVQPLQWLRDAPPQLNQ